MGDRPPSRRQRRRCLPMWFRARSPRRCCTPSTSRCRCPAQRKWLTSRLRPTRRSCPLPIRPRGARCPSSPRIQLGSERWSGSGGRTLHWSPGLRLCLCWSCAPVRAGRIRCIPSTSGPRCPVRRRCGVGPRLSLSRSFPSQGRRRTGHPPSRLIRPPSTWCCRCPAGRNRCTPSTSRTRRPGGRRNGIPPLLFRWRCDWPPVARREGWTPSHSGRLPCGLRSRAPVVRSCCTPSTSQVPVRTSHTRACDFRSTISPPRRRGSRSSARTPLARCSSRGRRSRLATAP